METWRPARPRGWDVFGVPAATAHAGGRVPLSRCFALGVAIRRAAVHFHRELATAKAPFTAEDAEDAEELQLQMLLKKLMWLKFPLRPPRPLR
jgi:hypothetical protein